MILTSSKSPNIRRFNIPRRIKSLRTKRSGVGTGSQIGKAKGKSKNRTFRRSLFAFCLLLSFHRLAFLLLSAQFLFYQNDPIVTKEHRAVDKNRWRAEPATCDHFVGIHADAVFVFWTVDFVKKFLRVQTHLLDNATHDVVLADVFILAPIRCKDPGAVVKKFSWMLKC